LIKIVQRLLVERIYLLVVRFYINLNGVNIVKSLLFLFFFFLLVLIVVLNLELGCTFMIILIVKLVEILFLPFLIITVPLLVSLGDLAGIVSSSSHGSLGFLHRLFTEAEAEHTDEDESQESDNPCDELDHRAVNKRSGVVLVDYGLCFRVVRDDLRKIRVLYVELGSSLRS